MVYAILQTQVTGASGDVAQPSGYGNPAVPAPSMSAATAMSSPQQPIRRQKGKQKTSRPGPSTGMIESLDVDIE